MKQFKKAHLGIQTTVPFSLFDESDERTFKQISHEFAKKFVLFRSPNPDMLAYHRLLVLCQSTIRDFRDCEKHGLSIAKYHGALKWLERASVMYSELYNGMNTKENREFDSIMYNFFLKGGVL